MKTKKLDSVGVSISENIKWALDFAQADLKTWQDKDWINADYGLKMFCRPFIYWLKFPQPVEKGYRYDFSRPKDWLSYVQPSIKKAVNSLMQAKKYETNAQDLINVPYPGNIHYDFVDGRLTLGFRQEKRFRDPQKKKETFKAGLLILLADYLSRLDLSRLKTCPECGRYFLSTGKQQFDTPQCSTRQRVEKFLTKQKNNTLDGAQTRPKRERKKVKPPRA